MSGILRALIAFAVMTSLVACGGQSDDTVTATTSMAASDAGVARVDTDRIKAAAEEPEMWLTYGGTYDEQRHSALGQINRDTLPELGVGWVYETAKPRGAEATPLVVDGVMYVSSAWSVVYALDAKTGEELWVYDPEVSGEDAAKGCCDVVNRGVAVHNGKVFIGVFDGRLEALDAATGEVIWSEVTVDQIKPYTITGAPRVFKDKVIIGNAGGELGVRGYVTAYDVDSGDLVWRFYTVPNPEKKPDGAASDAILAKLANETWGDDGAWVTDGGGGTAWDSIVYDTVNDQILIGVGNGSPWNPDIRDPNSDGDNLFLSSILAVDADTGEYRWHYQTTPRDRWDYTATQQIMLADLPLGDDGADRRVVMQAPKNGFFYVLDAADGELISATPFTNQNWTTGEFDENGRPVLVEEAVDLALYAVVPGPTGAHNWHPMAFNPDTGLVYIPVNEIPFFYDKTRNVEESKSHWNIGYDAAAGWPVEYPAGTLDAVAGLDGGSLLAWDPVKAEPRWAVPFALPLNGGVLSTDAGLVFQGNKFGDLVAYDAETGEQLWSERLVGNAAAAPMTYEIDGEQYLSVLSGWGSVSNLIAGFTYGKAVGEEPARVITFKLGGNEPMPTPMADQVVATPKSPMFGEPEQHQLGMQRYAESCHFCHGAFAVSGGVIPDLRWSAISASEQAWDQVVRDGALAKQGMVAFSERLSKEDTDAIRAYVIQQAWLAVANGNASAPGGN